ncbi:DUF1285 domain-containing protein [Pseudoalteromonas sp. SG43-7]|jgi:hypothetical protein|uniref:DUF1285 domain-containing protein n=2 Tax=Pseudoalteromonas TaxID=53246 RepID=A0ABY3FCL0_9GAMM|nr:MULTISPECIES: DUF1285 domain-containing protein [Pseudoalteromonas]MBB1294483.1 DUF1285 domain-containing protein [Pseudoalteromonas sp. SR41-4]MBB1301825.1 DUF1285 domain-containing protein [Pseudoalteromonas sp. SR44-8]MBB1310444.1 DUF1285 domain-containing protein [Pseudoalteromonas sp. SR41-8]MBB1332806.1 DUF1285 domain-containing protein [Pseudoalteromonas sp. SR41-6]MBB1342781.1 DUF1285 domain-containing protein [Pseudoalteromonas sp. SR45-6]|tara:strand:- start:14082 stop:14603 length:522 start_codon:yes stop_codon:yes gene_type:complete
MHSLNELATALEQPSKPFSQWQPQHCGELPIIINQQGEWLYGGSKITRIAMVKLFASVLCKEQDTFYLKTPIEKIAITVHDAPFIIVNWRFEMTEQGQVLCCVDNLQRTWLVTCEQPLVVQDYQGNDVPYLQLPYGCSARVSRSVFYQWAEIAQADKQGYFIQSAGQRFYLNV